MRKFRFALIDKDLAGIPAAIPVHSTWVRLAESARGAFFRFASFLAGA
jgi:hypothetical protein